MKNVSFSNGKGENLTGILHSPENGNKVGIVLSHGFQSSKDSATYKKMASALEREGFVVLRFDYYGHGKSGGKFEDFTVTEEIRDLKKALDFISKVIGVRRIGVYGSSLGGLVAMMQAAKDKRIGSLVLRAPLSVHEGIGTKAKGDILEVGGPSGKFRIKKQFYDDIVRYDAYKKAPRIKCPVLVIHGMNDKVVPPAQSKKLVTLLDEGKLEMFIGSGHFFEDEAKKATRILTTKWFLETLVETSP